MPKVKTHSGLKKRVHLTASGKLKRRKSFRSHILSSKTRKRKRQLRKATYVSKVEEKNLKMLLHR
jgi:large subunit ribosomal protein L35